MEQKVICYISADLNSFASLRKLRKFTTCAANRGFAVVASWPGFYWQKEENLWKLDFFKSFGEKDFDAVVVDGEYFSGVDILARQAEIAAEKKIPFVTLDIEVPGAISVMFNDDEIFGQILEHVVGEHRKKNICFIGDSAQEYTVGRYVKIFRDVCEKENIPDVDDRILLKEFYVGDGVLETVDFLKEKKPEAVICSENNIGNIVVNTLAGLGLSVPGDVIVTGINGIAGRRSGSPDLTGSKRNFTQMGDTSLRLIEKTIKGEDVRGLHVIEEKLCFSESCGCGRGIEDEDTVAYIRSLVLQREMSVLQERRQNFMHLEMVECKKREDLSNPIRKSMPHFTIFSISKRFLTAESFENGLHTPADLDEYQVLASFDSKMEGTTISHKQLRELALRQGKNAVPLMFYPVYVKNEHYGYAISVAPEFYERQMMMGRFMMNLSRSLYFYTQTVNVKERNAELSDMNEYLKNTQFHDSMTGMLNNRGLVLELENCKNDCIAKKQNIEMVCIDLDHLGNINDIYGHSEGDEAILTLGRIIARSAEQWDIPAHLGSDEFVVVIRSDEDGSNMSSAFLDRIKQKVGEYNEKSGKEYTINVNTSVSTIIPYPETDMGKVLDEALLNKRLNKNNRRTGFGESVELTEKEIAQSAEIKAVLDENRFRYAFQPIVDAHTGNIFGYEALMRPESKETISPLALIKYATLHQRLYDVERATFFNVMKQLKEFGDRIEGKKIFINSIPGYQLDYADYETLKKQYAELLKTVFIEITEQTEQDDAELRTLMERSINDGFGIAIDDYGCGYSNTTSLLRYTPNCVKIDRLLIKDLQDDSRKQHFVKNIIEFAHDNQFYALAEGVETKDELRASIALGADLIQGFYTARPSFELAEALDENIQQEIFDFNNKPEQHFHKLYVVSREKELLMTRLGLEMYTDVMVSGQSVTLIGNPDYPVAVKIKVKENTDSTITIRNLVLENDPGEVGIEIGDNASLTLILEGDNFIYSNGIKVPMSSSLILKGSGNLHIHSKCQEAFGLGNDLQHPYGNITSDISGELDINLNGEKAVGIGGCVPGPSSRIMLKGGDNSVKASATAFVGVGAFSGNVNVEMTEMHFAFESNVINGVSIGTPSGGINCRISNSFVEIRGGGKSITGIGAATKGNDNKIEILFAKIWIEMSAPRVVLMGCPVGNIIIYVDHSKVDLIGSGGRVIGAGSSDMSAKIILKSVGFDVKISSDQPLPIGASEENCDFGSSEPNVEVISYLEQELERDRADEENVRFLQQTKP